MLPNVTSPGTAPPAPLPPGLSTRADRGAQPSTGETSAAATRALTANRIDPPRVLPAVLALPEDARRRPPPDPDGPAGPPPAFEATPLQRERERLLARVDLRAPPPEPEPGAPARAGDVVRTQRIGAAPDAGESAARPATPRDPDIASAERLEGNVAELRRMAVPPPERALDLIR